TTGGGTSCHPARHSCVRRFRDDLHHRGSTDRWPRTRSRKRPRWLAEATPWTRARSRSPGGALPNAVLTTRRSPPWRTPPVAEDAVRRAAEIEPFDAGDGVEPQVEGRDVSDLVVQHHGGVEGVADLDAVGVTDEALRAVSVRDRNRQNPRADLDKEIVDLRG